MIGTAFTVVGLLAAAASIGLVAVTAGVLVMGAVAVLVTAVLRLLRLR